MKKDNLRTGIFIGRFQPFHIGHFSVVKKMAKTCDKLLIGVGSAEKSKTKNNPFTFDERKMMIELTLDRAGISNCLVLPIVDINNYPAWVEHVISSCPKFDVVFTGNPIVKKLFGDKKIDVEVIEKPDGEFKRETSASEVRKLMIKDGEWDKLCPDGVDEVIESIKGVDKVKRYSNNLRTPLCAADAIIELYDKKTEQFRGIPLIERKNPPYGWAIPGGFQDRGESLETTAMREAKEEVSLEIKLIHQLKTYSAPKRDPRMHVNSTVFIAKSYDEPKAADDAKTVKIFSPAEIMNLELAFDHKLILNDYFEWKKKQN